MSMKISVIGGVSIDFSQLEPCTQKSPVITQVVIGKKVRFIPAFVPRDCPANVKTQKPEYVTGRVVYVNREHRYFTAEYGWEGSKQRDSFKFSQIGKDVTVCG